MGKSSEFRTCSGRPKPPICPTCGAKSDFFADSSRFYSRDYGPVWACEPCGAWVGCHRGTKIALGRPANQELRTARKELHAVFDPVWKARQAATGDEWSRAQAYKWLAEQMGIDRKECHIGMFSVEQCAAAMKIIAPIHDRVRLVPVRSLKVKPKPTSVVQELGV